MELINATRMAAGYNIGMEASGRELLVIVVKGTFRILPQGGPEQFALHERQLPLVMADTFSGEPGLSAPVYEVDFAACKPRCDILLNGTAYAPRRDPVTRVEAGMRIGSWSKRFAVVGPRDWDCALGTIRATPPRRFLSQPVSYDTAFGGTDRNHEDVAEHGSYMPNPVGRGYHKHLKREWVDGKPLPATEELGRPIADTIGKYRPMALGAVGRGWEPRYRFAGTYDERWFEQHFPFLPPDFDTRYFQAAPEDQQVPLGFFNGGVEVLLTNLTPDGLTRFAVPRLVAPVAVFPKNGPREDCTAVLDTILIEPDEQRFCLTWRLARPLKHDVFEVARVQVGKKGHEWWQSRAETTFSGSDRPPRPVPLAP